MQQMGFNFTDMWKYLKNFLKNKALQMTSKHLVRKKAKN